MVKLRLPFHSGHSVKIFVLSFLCLSIVVTSFLAFRSVIRQPFYLDETDEATMGLKFSRIGPKTFHPVPEGSMSLSHPLLYTFTHAAVQRLFGPTELPLRLYGVFHYLVSLCLTLLILRHLTAGYEKSLRYVGLWLTAALYLVNPLLVQHSVVINADNNILTTCVLLFVFFLLRFENLREEYMCVRILLACLLALLLV